MTMKTRVALFAAALLISTSGLAEEVKREAVIVSVDGANINAQSREGPLTVVLSPDTKITETSGLASKKGRDAKSLLPGLIFTVKGDQQGSTVTAADITFKERDWRTAVATKAGTKQELGELRKAIIEGHGRVHSIGWGVSQGDEAPTGQLAAQPADQGWLRDPQRFPVRILVLPDEAKEAGIDVGRSGAQANVIIFANDGSIMNPIGRLWIRLVALFSYLQ